MNGKYILEGEKPKLVEDVLEWARWFETADRSVAKTDLPLVPEGFYSKRWYQRLFYWLNVLLRILIGRERFTVANVRVSTVFLGLDYSFSGSEPILFETMIFGGEHDEYQERYSTWGEAETGHQQALTLAKGGLK